MNPIRTTTRIALAAVLGAALAPLPACDSPTHRSTPAQVAAAGGNAQSAPAGTELAPLVVTVTDGSGRPVGGVPVTWAVVTGGGTITPLDSITNAQGQVSARWRLGTVAGQQSVTATVAGLTPVTFTATANAGSPTALVRVSGNDQQERPGFVVPDSLVAKLTDAAGNPIAGALVRWTVSPDGSISPDTTRTRADGTVKAQWTLGSYGAPVATAALVSDTTVRVTFTARMLTGIQLGALPVPNTLVVDTATLEVEATGPYTVTSVRAIFGTQTVPLTLSFTRWKALLNFTALPLGPFNVRIEATDSRGVVTVLDRPLRKTTLPTLTLQSPSDWQVSIGGQIRFAATCTTPDPSGCYVVVSDANKPDVALAQGTGTLDVTLNYSALTGTSSLVFNICAYNNAGGGRCVLRQHVYLVLRGNLTEVVRAPGTIVDYDDTRILYVDGLNERNALKVRSRATGQDQLVADSSAHIVDPHLSPAGVVYAAIQNLSSPEGKTVYEWVNGTRNVLVPTASAYIVRGTWLVTTQIAGAVMRRDLVTGAEVVVAPSASSLALGPNGDVVYVREGSVWRYRDGTTEMLRTGAPYSYGFVMTDGVQVVYQPFTLGNLSANSWAIYRPAGDVVIPGVTPWPVVGGGYVAYRRSNALFVLDASYVETQATFTNDPFVTPVAVGDNGGVLFTTALDEYYHVTYPPYPLQPTILERLQTFATWEWRNGHFVVFMGGSVLQAP
ncbi:MAG TPA: Ig-like domain-containing protein [Longimicrobium sp.]